jgi:putative ATP-dependent endonuclease of OLD family
MLSFICGGVMYLKLLKVWNFRKYGSPEDIDLDKPNLCLNLKKGLNILIGENDSGKTAIIDAIKLVLKTHTFEWIKADENDFYKNSDRFRIELIFDDMEKSSPSF